MPFADDTAAYLAISSFAEAQQPQADLDILQDWEVNWNMEFNPGKICQLTESIENYALVRLCSKDKDRFV